ncbi:LysM peptidoglycan-binding domain-containing protein [Demequina sp.]|uniref:LysM peptidoglycan-binding domain-containing protein n=1 Tax=Demequina sp. TaxID=2050685 RepID=UPI003A8C78EE
MTATVMTSPVMINAHGDTFQRPLRRVQQAPRVRTRITMIDTPAARSRRRAILVAVVIAFAAVFAPTAFASDGNEPPAVFDTYTVASGDTLWSIASAITPDGIDVRDVIADIQVLNAKLGAGLQAGEQIYLPEVG